MVNNYNLINHSYIRSYEDYLLAKNFDKASELFQEIKKQYNLVQQTSFIKLIYLKYVGSKKEISHYLYDNYKEFNLFNPLHKGCYPWNVRANELKTIFSQYDLTPKMQCAKNFILTKNQSYKIPLISHYVWVTNSNKSEDEIERAFWRNNKYFKPKLDLLENYKHILWTTNTDIIPKTIQGNLTQLGIDLKGVDSLFTENEFKEEKSILNEFLFNAIYIAAELKLMGIASDIIRYYVLLYVGGIYTDGDYRLYKNPDFLFKEFDAIFGYESPSIPSTCNGFLAAGKNHPVLNKVLELTYNNLIGDNSPEFSKYPCVALDKTSFTSGVPLFSVAAALGLNQNNNTDLILPYPSIIHNNGPNEKQGIKGIGLIGNDDFSGSWKDFMHLDFV